MAPLALSGEAVDAPPMERLTGPVPDRIGPYWAVAQSPTSAAVSTAKKKGMHLDKGRSRCIKDPLLRAVLHCGTNLAMASPQKQRPQKKVDRFFSSFRFQGGASSSPEGLPLTCVGKVVPRRARAEALPGPACGILRIASVLRVLRLEQNLTVPFAKGAAVQKGKARGFQLLRTWLASTRG
jgi:hypothetical protein